MARRDDSAAPRSFAQTIVRETERAARPQPATREAIDAAIAAFVRELTRPGVWRVRVPGTHSGGITHQGLLAVLASQGRDFLQPTIQLKQEVNSALRRQWISSGRVPSRTDLKNSAAPIILEVVETRFERGNGDVLVEPLTPRYAVQKRRLGRGNQPIGVASGELRRAVSRDAYVEWLDGI